MIAAGAASAGELDWARDALARNPALEVVSMDAATGTVTVRVRSTGELRRVRAGDVVAALPAATGTLAASAPAAATSAVNAPMAGNSAAGAAAPGAPAAGTGPSAITPALQPGERLIASGPGYSILASGPAPAAAAGIAPSSREAGASGDEALAAGDQGPARNLPVEHLHDPIICQGARLLHIDSRNLVFDGDAVSAEKGCEVHITNSSIAARGVGILARDASVHVDNSFVEGGDGAVEASHGAQIYARSSTFRGLIRRSDTAAFHDLGGNVGN